MCLNPFPLLAFAAGSRAGKAASSVIAWSGRRRNTRPGAPCMLQYIANASRIGEAKKLLPFATVKELYLCKHIIHGLCLACHFSVHPILAFSMYCWTLYTPIVLKWEPNYFPADYSRHSEACWCNDFTLWPSQSKVHIWFCKSIKTLFTLI